MLGLKKTKYFVFIEGYVIIENHQTIVKWKIKCASLEAWEIANSFLSILCMESICTKKNGYPFIIVIIKGTPKYAVSWNNDNYQTGVVKSVYSVPTFPVAAKFV